MSLQSKFAALLALCALVGVLTRGAALVFSELLQRELVWLFESATNIMRELSKLKRGLKRTSACSRPVACRAESCLITVS